ncbi:MAG: DUF952 domain-containing protein [Rhodospirillaceae bacterium]
MQQDHDIDRPAPQAGQRLYRLLPAADWRQAVADGAYRGAAHDAADGFIHLSTADQVEETAAKHYGGVPDLMVLTVDSARLDGEVKWEPSRGGKLFPHLYGTVPLEAVLGAELVATDRDGAYTFPHLRDEI